MFLWVVCFVAMLALTGSEDLGEAIAAELTAAELSEEDETGDDGDLAVSIATALRRTRKTASSRQVRRILKIPIPRENTWHGPS